MYVQRSAILVCACWNITSVIRENPLSTYTSRCIGFTPHHGMEKLQTTMSKQGKQRDSSSFDIGQQDDSTESTGESYNLRPSKTPTMKDILVLLQDMKKDSAKKHAQLVNEITSVSIILNEVQTKVDSNNTEVSKLGDKIDNNNAEIISLQQEIDHWKHQDKINKTRISALESKWVDKESSERRSNLLIHGCLESTDDHPKKVAADCSPTWACPSMSKPVLPYIDLVLKIERRTNHHDLL